MRRRWGTLVVVAGLVLGASSPARAQGSASAPGPVRPGDVVAISDSSLRDAVAAFRAGRSLPS